MELWKWNITKLELAVCFRVWQLLLDTSSHSFFPARGASFFWLLFQQQLWIATSCSYLYGANHPCCELTQWPCMLLSLTQHWEKCPFKALKRCRWMLFAISFQKLLMTISGSLSSPLCSACHPPPWVRECEVGTTRGVLEICWCNRTSCVGSLSSICNGNVK